MIKHKQFRTPITIRMTNGFDHQIDYYLRVYISDRLGWYLLNILLYQLLNFTRYSLVDQKVESFK